MSLPLVQMYKTWPSWRRAGALRNGYYGHGPPGGGQTMHVTQSRALTKQSGTC